MAIRLRTEASSIAAGRVVFRQRSSCRCIRIGCQATQPFDGRLVVRAVAS